ncbi:MAG: hypothetical protein HFJ94_07060 [Muribaculaceae bacterium]|nr:hypothetical protein [Muribaculaceae bacterium]
MKKNITLRAEWVIATLALPQAIKLIVLEAVLAYIVNGYITEIADPQAAEVFATIKADYDAREAKRLKRAADRAAQKAQKAQSSQKAPAIPGVLPQIPPTDLQQRIENERFARFARDARGLSPFKYIDADLAGELALQITDWWRAHPTEEMPTTGRLRREFEERFNGLYSEYGTQIDRERWLRKVSPYFPEQ